jgi:hypothetical protein
VDLSLYKLVIRRAKHLKQVTFFGLPNVSAELLIDVNIAGKMRDDFARALFTAT